MATITAFSKSGNDKFYKKIISAAATLASSDDIEIEGLPDENTHVNIGVQMFDISEDLTLGSAGTIVIETMSSNTMQWEVLGSPIDSTAPVTLSIEGNIVGVRAVETLLAGCVTWKLVVTCNRR